MFEKGRKEKKNCMTFQNCAPAFIRPTTSVIEFNFYNDFILIPLHMIFLIMLKIDDLLDWK